MLISKRFISAGLYQLSLVLCTKLSVSVGGEPVEALDFVPGEFGLQLSMCEGNNPEALPRVRFQSLAETARD